MASVAFLIAIAFNRTIVELKHGFPGAWTHRTRSFNRTNVELKQRQGRRRLPRQNHFNRTRAELKFLIGWDNPGDTATPLIESVWH